ncbi:helix-turn-helix domain-containing protein [Pseudotenacibaculum sp. MALMAid0570]|uniref:helix-turn-helix domain-containing protein n=1 Tax=Pseudotenacibaculum sp. MALMAid0570 TaxID=3143938 RepID=UPI0032DEB831
MIYEQEFPRKELKPIIQKFWIIDSVEDATIRKEKIIPDGYPEMIFHYGDPYKINISGTWEQQSNQLIAGQIRNHFFLENIGVSRMFAIQFQPWAIKELFALEMSSITDQVIEMPNPIKKAMNYVNGVATSSSSFQEKVRLIEEWFLNMKVKPFNSKRDAVRYIHEKKGLIQLHELENLCKTSERTLERYFKSYVGLSPKFYSRIIRFSSIFRLIQEGDIDWQDIVYKAGYYDQSHFIKNFKEFTGEDPSRYGFSEKNMANFFLKK